MFIEYSFGVGGNTPWHVHTDTSGDPTIKSVLLLTYILYHDLWDLVTAGIYSAAITSAQWQLWPNKASCLRRKLQRRCRLPMIYTLRSSCGWAQPTVWQTVDSLTESNQLAAWRQTQQAEHHQ